MHPLPDRLAIARRREEIIAIAKRHGATNVRLFGSVVRGDTRDGSDVDILVTLDPARSMLDVIRLQLDLEDLLGMKVDVVEDKALSPLIRDAVLSEAVAV